MQPAISLSKVGKRFGRVVAIEEISLEINEGEIVSFIGPSGCGKTTLLRIIAGLERQFEGGALIFNNPPACAISNHEIGVAFQRSALAPWKTALQNVQMTLDITRSNGLSPAKLLEEFGLGEFLNQYPHQLSGGMQQRVNIAAAVVHDPKVLLLDEPFGALDELTRESMCDWLSRVLSDKPKTVCLVTHSVEEAVFLSDRVVILSSRPAKIHDTIEVPFPHPRERKFRTDLSFLDRVSVVRESLYEIVGNGGTK